MDFGIILGNLPIDVSERDHFDSILRQAEAAQEAGMNHLLIGQHFLFEGSRWFQPIPLLARLAGELDSHVRLCTQILIGPLYHPVMLAEELATLDVVTGGRISVGLGLGYLPAEYEALGIPFNERGARLTETIKLLKLLWTQDRVTFDGTFFQLDDVPVHIKPLQQPHPPIWVGAGSPAGVRRAARYGDAWPITPQEEVAELPRLVRTYAEERVAAGRSPGGRQPLRREIMIGSSREDALQRAVDIAAPWYINMAATGHNEYVDPAGLQKSIASVMEKHWILGTADECVDQLRSIGSAVPVNPIITRAHWPGMTTEASVRYIRDLGEKVIPSLANFEPLEEVTTL